MSDFGQAAKKVRRLRENLHDEHEEATEDGMDRVRGELRVALRFNDSVARRVLINDIRTGEARGEPQRIAKRVHMPEWAKYLEDGTGIYSDEGYKSPANPPTEAIRTWAVAKNITPTEFDTLYGMVGAIATQIAREGNEAHPFIDPVWNGPHGAQQIIEANERAMTRALRRSF